MLPGLESARHFCRAHIKRENYFSGGMRVDIRKYVIIALLALLVISVAFIVYCVLTAADWQEDWDEAEVHDVERIDD